MESLTCPECRRESTDARCPTHGHICVAPGAVGKVGSDPLLGTLFGAKYRIIDTIGAGGFGQVYRGIDETIGRPVAIKVIRHREGVEVERLRARFYREARILGRLESDACVPLFEYGADGETLFMVMPFLDGASLAESIAERGRLDEGRAIDIAAQVLGGLAAAHRLGLIHRDIKPGNIMIVRGALGETRVKLLDFGIARVQYGDLVDDGVATHTGAFLGSPAYVAPEQARGAPTVQSDLYALGVVLFEMLTGRRPFEAPHAMAIVAAHLVAPVPPHMQTVGVSPALQAVVHRALAKDPDDRWRTAAEMRAALEAIRHGQAPLVFEETAEAPPTADAPWAEDASAPAVPPTADADSGRQAVTRTLDTDDALPVSDAPPSAAVEPAWSAPAERARWIPAVAVLVSAVAVALAAFIPPPMQPQADPSTPPTPIVVSSEADIGAHAPDMRAPEPDATSVGPDASAAPDRGPVAAPRARPAPSPPKIARRAPARAADRTPPPADASAPAASDATPLW